MDDKNWRVRFNIDEVTGDKVYATACTDFENPGVETELWELSLDQFPEQHPPEPGLSYWLVCEDGEGHIRRHEMHDKVWTQEEIDAIEALAKEMYHEATPDSARMVQWISDNCGADGAQFAQDMRLTNPQKAFVMLRHQVRDVSEHMGVSTERLKELYRIALEEEASASRAEYFPNLALQHLTNMNPYGVSDRGEVPLCQCRDGEEPEFVEWVYVADLLEALR